MHNNISPHLFVLTTFLEKYFFGTTFKLLLWWVQAGFYREFWRFDFLFGHLMWNLIYILRAITEERHLGKFEEYREYMKKVKYRFIPWVV